MERLDKVISNQLGYSRKEVKDLVKEGYKETEIGAIPEDWGLTSAKNLMKIETGSRNTEHKSDNGKYLFFRQLAQFLKVF